MSLLFDPADKLARYVAILDDRGSTVCRELMADRPLDDDELDDIASQCVEIIEAAQVIEVFCSRAVRWVKSDLLHALHDRGSS